MSLVTTWWQLIIKLIVPYGSWHIAQRIITFIITISLDLRYICVIACMWQNFLVIPVFSLMVLALGIVRIIVLYSSPNNELRWQYSVPLSNPIFYAFFAEIMARYSRSNYVFNCYHNDSYPCGLEFRRQALFYFPFIL